MRMSLQAKLDAPLVGKVALVTGGSRGIGVISDRLQTLVQGVAMKEPYPFIIVTHVGEVESQVADMLQPGKSPLECR
jgi:hypothetical protein